LKRLILAFALVFAAAKLGAQERINSYDILVEVRKDGSLDVTERIGVRAEGNSIRRGIYRDFPTRYRDRFGNQVRVDLEVKSVEKNDVIEPWFTENMSNGIRINTGNDNFLPVPADYVYTLRYRTTRQLGFFADHDELYWNAIGTGWVFPIERGSVEVRLPSPVPVNQLHAEGYTGPQDAKGTAYVAELPEPGVARYRLTQPLGSYEGFTIVLTFPKGLIPAPTQADKLGWILRDNRGILVALAGFFLLLAYMFRQWSTVGRDPDKGIVIARYEPREGQTPGGLHYLQRMGYDMRSFTGDVLSLAVAGHLRIHENEKMFKNEWQLEQTQSANGAQLSEAQAALLHGLFRNGSPLVLKNTNATTVSGARDAHRKMLDKEFEPRYFKRNSKPLILAWFIAIATGIAAFVSSRGFGLPVIIGVGVLMFISLIGFAYLIKAPTAEGRQLLDEVEGLKLYMSVAERDELKSMKGPDEPVLDAARYESLLPFAVALGVEDAWTKKFTAAAGAAAAAQAANSMGWYSGHSPVSNLGDFSRSIGSSLSSTISSASTPPGSSSGSGGGGSSGGGGGGGGGGGR
jgi:uncharacterized membrane protein YgcG